MLASMLSSDNMQQRRATVQQQSDCHFVDADEFCRMLISNRKLVRVDQPEAMLRGLFDPQAGVRFIVEVEKLHNHRALR